MSLLDRAPVLALVYPVVPVDDGYGGTKPGEGAPVTVRVFAQPMTGDDPAGWQSPERFKLISRTLPAGTWSRVQMMDREWSVVRAPREHSASRNTRFTSVEVVERGHG